MRIGVLSVTHFAIFQHTFGLKMANFKHYLPKNNTDIMATIFTLVGIHAIGIFELLYMVPRIASQTSDYPIVLWYIHNFSGIYIYINALSSFWKTIVTDSTVRGVMLPTFTKEGKLINENTQLVLSQITWLDLVNS